MAGEADLQTTQSCLEKECKLLYVSHVGNDGES